ncbi:alpha/beta fold hydrolase [Oceanicella sp. SM1341]|uniref:alpha/beta fold hydrolase n=1 Tax=Oceanicella sp. SM1341 TaxID=1548889 RepID=UPI000E4CD70A|nr:alpha/beta hydrolase [Oceanicella sp. SM1341]
MITMLRNAMLAAAAIAALAAPLAARAEETPVRNIVLVHGAFADASGWRGVHDILTARGYHVSEVQNPLTSLAEDVAATRRVLDRQDGPAVLVGHSWGGSVITEAGIHPAVRALVYVAALAPDAGETTAQQYAGFTTPPEFVIETGADGFGFVPRDQFRAAFAADLPEADAAFLAASQVPINMSVFATPLQHAAWRDRPSRAVFGTADKAFDQRMLHAMAERIGAQVTELPGASHALFISQAEAVADVIEEAARQASAAEETAEAR